MSIAGAIETLLNANAAVVTAASTRIYPTRVRSEDVSIGNPSIVYNIGVTPEDDKDGVSTLDHSDVQIDVYADGYAAARDLADNVRIALDRKTGVTDSVNIDTIIFLNRDELYDDISDSDRIIMDFRIRIKK